MTRTQNIPWMRISVEATAIVASILLAFAIDAWWQNRQDRIDEQEILAGLRSEFIANLDILTRHLAYTRRDIQTLESIVTLIESGQSNNANSIVLETLDEMTTPATTDLGNGLAIIGQLYGPPYEHALAVNVTGVGLVILVGCSHPGVDNIVAKAVEDLDTDPYVVLGGFHESMSTESDISYLIESLQDLSLSQIYPFHCSGDLIREYLETNYKESLSDDDLKVLILNALKEAMDEDLTEDNFEIAIITKDEPFTILSKKDNKELLKKL